MSIKIGIFGYGNLGKGVESAISQNTDMSLVAIFSKRKNIKSISGTQVFSCDEVLTMQGQIDVMIVCGGSANDLPYQTPYLAKYFNVLDSYDNHENVVGHYDNVDKMAKENLKVGLISVGWDPGLFSLIRTLNLSIIPAGIQNTFWGKGISQGHSDAIRKINGVEDARAYTIPSILAIRKAKKGVFVEPKKRCKRVCFVVVKKGKNKRKIAQEIKEIRGYFLGYKTVIYFVSNDKIDKKFSKLFHTGRVVFRGKTGVNLENEQIVQYCLNLSSNPQFTGSVMLAYARAVYKFYQEKNYGCKTILDVPISYISPLNNEGVLQNFL